MNAFWKSSVADLEPINQKRELWVDIAKGISISLVVLWHVVGERFLLSEALILVRMPLFFFVAGLFARKIFSDRTSKAQFFFKVSNFIYLYVLWALIAYFLTTLPVQLRNDGIDLSNITQMFYSPVRTLWFIYALFFAFLIVYVFRKLPIFLILSIFLVGYYFAAIDGNWRNVEFFNRVLRLIPFFFLGVISFHQVRKLVVDLNKAWFLFLPVALFLAYIVYDLDFLRSNPLVTFSVSLFGIFSVLLFSHWLSFYSFSKFIAAAGLGSLYIYVVHRVTQFYLYDLPYSFFLDPSFKDTGMGVALGVVATFAIIVISFVVGKYLNKISYGILFNIPKLSAVKKLARRS